jgi:hypothetical protein
MERGEPRERPLCVPARRGVLADGRGQRVARRHGGAHAYGGQDHRGQGADVGEDTPTAEANALRGGTEEYVPTAAKTTVAKARTARASEEDTPTAKANALRGGTEEYAPTVTKIIAAKPARDQPIDQSGPRTAAQA